MESFELQTPIGMAVIKGDEQGISSISLEEKAEFPSVQEIPGPLKEAVDQIKAYFKGDLKTFNLTLNPKGTDFQQRVWKELQKIPCGRTVSYLEVANALGDGKAIRAVAAANGKNPLWIVIPCHRVIGKDGSLTGYAGGLWRKEWLLNHEHAVKQQTLF